MAGGVRTGVGDGGISGVGVGIGDIRGVGDGRVFAFRLKLKFVLRFELKLELILKLKFELKFEFRLAFGGFVLMLLAVAGSSFCSSQNMNAPHPRTKTVPRIVSATVFAVLGGGGGGG